MVGKKKRINSSRKTKPTPKRKVVSPVEEPKQEVSVTKSETVVVVDQPEQFKEKHTIEAQHEEKQANEQPFAESENEPVTENAVENPVSVEDNIAIVEESNMLRWILILIILFLMGLVGGLFYFFWFQSKPETKQQSSLKTVAVYTPTPTVDQAEKSKYTIKVLNGSGISGQAAAGRDLLKSKSYTISSIGNADKSTYTKTVIQTKDKVSKIFVSGLKADLSSNYTVDDTISTLNSTEQTDVVVIIGSESK